MKYMFFKKAPFGWIPLSINLGEEMEYAVVPKLDGVETSPKVLFQ